MMNKPWVIWSLSGLCALLVFGAMGMITRHTLSLEKERARAEAKAEFEGWVRLALWRLDSAAAGILAEENKRPVAHFRDVHRLGGGRAESSNVKLHFEVNKGMLSTPKKTKEWGGFQTFLNGNTGLPTKNRPIKTSNKDQSKKVARIKGVDNNLDLLCAVASSGKEVKVENPSWASQVEVAQQQRIDTPNANSIAKSAQGYQTNYNRAEKAKRQVIVNKAIGNGLQSQADKDESISQRVAAPSVGGGGVSPEVTRLLPLIPVWLDQDLILVREISSGSGKNITKRVQGVWLDVHTIRESLLDDISDLLPNARLEPVKRSFDFTSGKLVNPDAEDPMVMVALPWRLIPGEMAVVTPDGWTPMRKTLAVAWVGAMLAALAAVILLRGVVKLSERRASFVSSVTHELRTPLTTFSLYSDMLAEGMIKDEEKQHEYLLTLRRESARLTHLVENVLAYSRIERGSARARVENVKVGEMVDRMVDRLSVRAEEVEMTLVLIMDAEISGREIHVDITAVEQIIFNLVDNASKYASGDDYGKEITLRVSSSPNERDVTFQICDDGPGILKSEHRRLFRAFHKSAQEAAHTKPGVGLGLALSRRLARALGGDLKIIEQERGACFELTISGR